jgi:rSAM/selenodomain-associated transferase 1
VDKVRIIVFGKEPRPGRVKTRLAKTIGDREACAVYEKLLARTLGEALGTGLPVHLALADSPSPGWVPPVTVPVETQTSGDLGQRMASAFDEAFHAEADRVVLVGSDAPGCHRGIFLEALQRLDAAPVVLGPSEDGGYYLVGQQSPGVDLFRGIPWSSQETYRCTVNRLHELDIPFEETPMLTDLDTLDDLRRMSHDKTLPRDLRSSLERCCAQLRPGERPGTST